MEALAERLVAEGLEGTSVTRRGLCLEAVRFHGRIHVMEGNRRLWALQRAAQVLERALEVQVRVYDLYLGRVRGRCALRVCWDKYTSQNDVASVEFRETLAQTPVALLAAAAGEAQRPAAAARAEALTRLRQQELEVLAIQLGIKQKRIGWATCCPPKGAKADIIDAVLRAEAAPPGRAPEAVLRAEAAPPDRAPEPAAAASAAATPLAAATTPALGTDMVDFGKKLSLIHI